MKDVTREEVGTAVRGMQRSEQAATGMAVRYGTYNTRALYDFDSMRTEGEEIEIGSSAGEDGMGATSPGVWRGWRASRVEGEPTSGGVDRRAETAR